MEKEFVTYEIALELKKLGFDEPCFGNYVKLTATQTTFFVNDVVDEIDRETPLHENLITKAPTFSQVFRWFREKYDLNYEISYAGKKGEYYAFVNEYVYGNNGNSPSIFTYEEAESACLQKLIEIVKTK